MRARRLLSVPAYLLAWGLCLATAALWLPLSVLVDVLRPGPAVALRSAALVCVYLSCEVIGLAASAVLWGWRRVARVDEAAWQNAHFRLQAGWGASLFGATRHLFGLELALEGDAALGRGPYLLLMRHASTGDTLLASALVARPHGMRLRYVLKRELLWDPCIDIVGQRLPNVFVERFSDDSAREVQRVHALARGLGPRDAVLIYPEGSRFSVAKRLRALERLERAGNAQQLACARACTHVLPPRLGGTLALLDATAEADVVVCAHTGFEGAASLGQIWRGALVHRTIRVQFRRIARREIPVAREARIAWLLDTWRGVDAWIDQHQVV
ncbi:MAG: lysophospholipid acyltransferase family protein [Myxococcales bacterium]|nr:lysophospholipid acyltransferase family protein [Myxococcales bacterium]MDH5565409.1 lysophospholipid acyltransferase family protein [Myxococcales bacterium]